MVGYHVDYLLSAVEKYNYFNNSLNFFSKMRWFPVVGLAAGFAFDTDSMIVCNVKAPLFGQELAAELLRIY
jgi:hypothetical protein